MITRTKFLHKLVQSLYSRSNLELTSGSFKVSGDIVDVFPSYADHAFKIHFFGDEIEEIEIVDNSSKHKGHKFFSPEKFHLHLKIKSLYLKSISRVKAHKMIMQI